METTFTQATSVAKKLITTKNKFVMRSLILAMAVILGIGNAWAGGGGSSNYYASLQINQSGPTGAGSVYVANSNTKPGTANAGTAVKSAATTTSGGNVTMYWWVDINPGYNVTLSNKVTGGPYSAATANGNVSCKASTSKNGTQAYTATATFVAVTVNSVDAASKDLAPTNPSTDYPFTVTFATSNLKTIALDLNKSPETADGKFTITSWALDGANVKATGKFNGGGTYGGASRNNSTTVSLQSKASGSAAKTCTVTANFPAMAFVSVSADDVYASQGESGKTGSATFKYNYAAEDDFPTTPTLTPTSGTGTFTVTGYTVTPDFAKGETTVTVNYSFDTNNGIGDTPATLTLTAANGDVRTVTVTGHSEAAATNDVSVTTAAGVTTEYATWAAGLTAANASAGSTLKLLRDIDLTGTYGITGTQGITQTMTLDLNGKTLSGAINGSILNPKTAGKTLTIKDSKTGGRIQNITPDYDGITYGVNISAGTVNLESGTIYAENQKQYNYGTSSVGGTASNTAAVEVRAVRLVAGAKFNMSGGKVEAHGTRAVRAIYQESSKANTTEVNISGGEVYAEAPSYVYGIFAYGKVNISGTAQINVKINDGLVNGNATYQSSKFDSYTLHRYGYAIYMTAYANKTPSACYFGTLTMTGGTINVENVNKTLNGTSLNTEHTYGIYMGIASAGMGNANGEATDGTNTQKASSIGSIENATINVTHAGVQVYGIDVLGSYNSFNNTTTPFTIKNSTINVTAWQTVYGALADVSIDWSNALTTYTGTGRCSAGNIELTNTTINATTTGGTGAYCAWASATYGTVADAKANTGARSTGNATYKGEYAVAATLTVNSGTYTASAATSSAYAVGSSDRAITIRNIRGSISNRDAVEDPVGSLGGNAEAYPELNIHGGDFSATTGTTTAVAVKSGGNTLIDGGTFNAYAGTTTAYGLYVTAGKTTANGVSFPASATTIAYGVYVNAAISDWSLFPYAGEVELNNCNATATARTTTDARAVYVNGTTKVYTQASFDAMKTANNSNYQNYGDYAQVGERSVVGKATINGGTYSATAETTTAYGIYVMSTRVSTNKEAIAYNPLVVKNATVTAKTNTGTTAYGIQHGGGALIEGCTISATAGTTTASGVRAIDKTTVIKNSTITAKGTDVVYGLEGYVDASTAHGYCWHGDFDLSEAGTTKVTAESTGATKAYTIYLNAKAVNVASGNFAGDYATAANATINGGTYIAKTNGGTSGYTLALTGTQTKGTASAQPEVLIEGGKFNGATAEVGTAGVAGHVQLKGGYYVHNTNLSKYIPEGYEEFPLPDDRPEYTEGYRYAIEPVGNHGNYVCQIGSTKYKTLEEALQAVTSGKVIYMIANYTMTTPGDYVLPSGATLLIPYKTGSGAGATTAIGNSAKTTTSATTPSLFRKLTFGAGVNLTCFGTIETSAEQKANGQYGANVGMPSGAYGQIQMDEGSHISLEANSRLNCWGYITGKGTINVKKDAKILEGFQMGDWCGGSNYSTLNNNSQKVFPVTHYFYQSIECPVTYRPGSRAYGSTHVNVTLAGTVGQDDVPLVGTSGSMFIMDDNDVSADTWVMKDYDEETDQCIWTINSGASIGNLTISISGYNMKSANYDLPITTNMTIVLNYGEMALGQNTVLLPGSQLIINKQGTAALNGVKVTAYDAADWTSTKRYFATYSPTWGTTNPRSSIAVKSAEVFLHGKLDIRSNGGLYTTPGGANIHSTNADAGEVIYTTAAQGNTTNYYLQQGGTTRTAVTTSPAKLKNTDGSYASSAGTASGKTWTFKNDVWDAWGKDGCFFVNAQDEPHAKPAALVQLTSKTPDANHLHHDAATGLRNFVWDENCYWWEVVTEPTPEGYYRSINADNNGDYNYYYYDNAAACWKIKKITVTWNINGSNTNYSVGYGTKPEWLGATPTKTSSSSDYVWRWDGWTKGSDATVIANNDLPFVTENTTFTAHFYEKFYEYNITFKNDDGTVLDSRNWNKGTTPSYEGTPTKNPTAAETYEFNGTWTPAIATVSGSATYVANYTSHPRAYTITFLNYDMSKLGTAEVVYNNTPSNATYLAAVAPKTEDPYKPDNSAYSFEFSGWRLQGADENGFAQVKGNQTYIAQFNQTTKKYKISFVDDDGETVLHYLQLEYGQTPSYTWANPSKQDAEWTYSFTGWTPATFSEVQGPQTYVANYNKTKREYTITWKDGDGNTLTTSQVAYGETPAYSGATPTKTSTSTHSYVFNNTWSPAIVAVTGEATYTAQFNETERTYRVTWDAATNGGICATEFTDFSYNAAIGTLPVATKEGHTFNGWFTSATGGTQITTSTKVTADVTYHAQFTINKYTITWVDGNGETLKTEQVEYGQTPAYTGATPTKNATAQYTYTFNNTWSPAIVAVTEAATYTAQFGSTVNEYTITWVDGNGTTLKTEQVAYGTTPAYTGATPTKTATAQYTYAFNNTWSPAIVAVEGAATYTAQFNSTVNQYTLTLEANHADWGTLTGGGKYDYNSVRTITATPKPGFKFVKWNDDNTNASREVTVTADVTYTATFDYDMANYTVKHWQQNIDDDEYTEVEDDRQTDLSGTIGKQTAAEAKTYEGFTAQDFSQVTIAVSGTVVNIYYNRNPYTITFDSNGGPAVASITQGYGTAVTAPASPHRDGYSFAGWSPAVPSTMPLNGTTCVAQWNENVHMVAVTSGGNGSISGSVSGVGVSTPSSEITATPDAGYKFDHWTIPEDVTIAGGKTIYDNPITINAVADGLTITAYFEPKTYNIVYKDKDGADFSGVHGSGCPTTHTYATPTDLVEPTKENFYFEGWYTSSDCSTGKVTTLGATDYTSEITLYANWLSNSTKYTVTWQDGSGSGNIIKTEEIAAGQIPEFDYQKPATEAYRFELFGWSDADNVRYEFPTKLPPVTKDVTYYALYNPIIRNKQVSTDVKVEDTERADVTTVRPGGRLNVTTGSLTTTDFVLEATLDNSGELLGDVKADNVYFDLKIDDPAPRHWHAFSVPFQVNLKKAGKPIQINGETLTLGRGYDIVYYDGAARATNGKSPYNWKYVEDEDSILVPGRAYMIASASRKITVVRFTKDPDSSAPIHFAGTLSVDKNHSGKTADCGWNSFGNPMTYHTVMDADFEEFQVHNGGPIGDDKYFVYRKESYNGFIVGKAVFVQVGSNDNIDISSATNETVIIPKAPRRTRAERSADKIDVCIAPQDGEMADRLYIALDENKIEDKYVVVADLAKMGVSTMSAQMWVNRYGEKLCKNTVAPIHGQADYPLGIFVPAEGEYEIFINTKPNDEVIYLTFDGRPIWNLNFGPYTGNFEKGTTERYGLRRVQTVATDIDNLTFDGNDSVRKMLVDDKVYIIRNGETYTITGQHVK